MMWPDYDKKLRLINDWVTDTDLAIERCEQKRTAIQAGGACGVWPLYLADHFERVLTFEPQPDNYDCLIQNIQGKDNIYPWNAALGHKRGRVAMINPSNEADNCGTWHLIPGDTTDMVVLDDLNVSDVDLICLDVEGFELEALQGAQSLIEKYRPVIMLEEKNLPHMKRHCSAARTWLQQFGYVKVADVHRDVVLVCEQS